MAGKMIALVLALGLAGCSDAIEYEEKVAAKPEPAAQPKAEPTATASASAAKGGARAVAVTNDQMEFSYAYPAAAGAEPELKKLLDTKLDAAKAEITASVKEAQDDAKANDYPYRPHSLNIDWRVVADLPGWLSLSEHVGSYSGGAHGNYGTSSMIWDRGAKIAREATDLFTSPAALQAAITAPYCKALDAERAKRNGQPVEPGGTFSNCPKLEELTVLLGSTNGKAFNRIGLIADPYVAGSYAEGDYEVTLPVNAAVLRAVKPEFRSAFTAGG